MRFLQDNGRLLLLAVFAIAVVLVRAEPALAEAAHGDAAVHGGEENKLGFLGLERYDLGIYTLIVFGLMLLILGKYAWPQISEGLKKREAAIVGAREEAVKDRHAAEQRLVEAKRQLDEAAQQARAIVEEARRDAEALRASEREVGIKEAASERERAKREIESAKDVALQEIYLQAVQLAATLSSKTIRRQLSAEDHRRLLDESLAEIKKNVQNA